MLKSPAQYGFRTGKTEGFRSGRTRTLNKFQTDAKVWPDDVQPPEPVG